MDDQLKINYLGNTIDTNTRAKIKVGSIRSEGKKTLAKPPLIVNKGSAVYQKWLFVYSGLRAKNEDEEQFRSSSVIDVYDLSSKGKYLFSFYLFNYDGKKLNSFKVLNHKLVAIFDHHVVFYELAPKYFKRA